LSTVAFPNSYIGKHDSLLVLMSVLPVFSEISSLIALAGHRSAACSWAHSISIREDIVWNKPFVFSSCWARPVPIGHHAFWPLLGNGARKKNISTLVLPPLSKS